MPSTTRSDLDTPRLLRGECLCREVGYEVADLFEYVLFCHCTDCQRTTGSAFKPLAGIPVEHLTVRRGESSIRRLGDAVNFNASCNRCSSPLFSIVRDGGYAHVTLGTLLNVPSRKPNAHIFVRSKAPWHVIGDDLPQFQAFPQE